MACGGAAKAVWTTVAGDNPNHYWDWHHAVFKQQGSKGSGWAERSKLLDITERVGIDVNKVKSNIDAHRKQFERQVSNETTAANQASIRGTPAFYIYNRETKKSKTIIGAQPYSQYRSAIRSLAK
ncbi:DsbA family protein [Halocatena marina]|uniref:DsbA family protein n=1 Tax=Halocatena marina TaxID=2934937 RepID=A0ABD5YNF7_9EURY